MSGAPQYLLVLHLAERQTSGPVAPGTIATALDRSPSATTEMLQRLEDRGLVVHEPYEGATLTPDGRERAEELHEIYATLAAFFDQVLKLENSEREALQLMDNVSPPVAERLASILQLDADTEPSDEEFTPSFL